MHRINSNFLWFVPSCLEFVYSSDLYQPCEGSLSLLYFRAILGIHVLCKVLRVGDNPIKAAMGTGWLLFIMGPFYFNSLAPAKFECNFRYVIFKQLLAIDGWGITCEIALIWMSLDFTDDQSTLVQVMAWCRQAASNYLRQCWPRSLSPYGVTRPQCVNPSMYK